MDNDLATLFGYKTFNALAYALGVYETNGITENRSTRIAKARAQDNAQNRFSGTAPAYHRNNTIKATTIVDAADIEDQLNPFLAADHIPERTRMDADDSDLEPEDRVIGGKIWAAGLSGGLHSCFASLCKALVEKASRGYCCIGASQASNTLYTDIWEIPRVYTRYQIIPVSPDQWEKGIDLLFPCTTTLHQQPSEQAWSSLSYRNQWFFKVRQLSEKERGKIRDALLKAADEFRWTILPHANKLFDHMEHSQHILKFPAEKSRTCKHNWQRIMINPKYKLTRADKNFLRSPPIHDEEDGSPRE
jgi:hypothetical protein